MSSSTIFMQVTRHDIKDKKSMGTMSEAYPHLIFDKFSTKVIPDIPFLMRVKHMHFNRLATDIESFETGRSCCQNQLLDV